VIDPEYLDVFLPAKTTFIHKIKAGHTVFAYVFEGEGYSIRGRILLPTKLRGQITSISKENA